MTAGSLPLSESMETEEKTGSVLVGKTPEAVSVLFGLEVVCHLNINFHTIL